MLRRGEISSQCEVLDRLVEAQKLREKGKRIEQFQTWYLHVFVKDRFRENMEEGLGSVDNVKIALFLFGVFLVYVGLAYGSGTMKPPSTVEGVGPFLSAMIKNQGMVLVPVAACIGSFLILQVIQDHLQSHVRRMQSSFDDALLNVVIFGQDIRHCLDPLEGG
ncbi:MAG TPA: hypothetical protein VMU13_02025 [Candidatus Paceibacterota bacterium]|nr:hypothetical protein [Candidatus Paceibacterota bacterium]